MDNVKEFFDKHPGVDEVHEAMGYLFIDADDAQKFCGGTGVTPATYKREHFNHTVTEQDIINNPELKDIDVKPGDEIQIPVNGGAADEEMQKAAESAEKDDAGKQPPIIINNDATTFGKSAEDIEAQAKQDADAKKAADKKAADAKKAADKKAKELAKEYAKKAAANGKPSNK